MSGAVALLVLTASASFAETPETKGPVNDYPTLARVEYVQECINRLGGSQNRMYQCVCVVDRMADALTYDEFVESMTYARYSTLPGEGGGLFRDTDEAKQKAKLFRTTEQSAFRACNLPVTADAARTAPPAPKTEPSARPEEENRPQR